MGALSTTRLDHGSAVFVSSGSRVGGVLRGVLVGGAVVALWVVVADAIVAGGGYLLFKRDASVVITLAYAAGHLFAGALLMLAVVKPDLVRRFGARVRWLVLGLETWRGVAVLIASLSVLRVVWLVCIPTEPTSDNLVYHGLARTLVAEGVYDSGRDRAYWPPGYPFFLAGLYWAFGCQLLVAKLANVVLAGLTELGIWRFVRREAGARSAAVAVLLTGFWPWRLFHVDVISYDDLTVFLLVWSLWLLPSRRAERHVWPRIVGAGLVLGYACLVRSTIAVLPAVVAGWWLLQGVRFGHVISRTVVYGLVMLLPIVPWSVRNALVFDRFVPLTTNAGMNFYTSWAPGTIGGFHKPAVLELQAAAGDDELRFTSLGMRMGWEAIRAAPARAVWVAASKQMLYLGSDNWLLPVESYQAALGSNVGGAGLKTALHTLTNGYYVILFCLPLFAPRRACVALRRQPLAWLCLVFFLSGLVIHTVFQSQARYHLIYLPFWSVLLALFFCRPVTSASTPEAARTPAGRSVA